MLHLFKRVYLAIDESLNTSYHRLVISQDYGCPMGAGFIVKGQLLKYASSIDSLVGPDNEFSNYLEFFVYLDQQHSSLNDDIVIYADRDSFVKIGTNFFKALLPLANVQDVYRLLSYYTVREVLLHTAPGGQSQNYEKLKYKSSITEAEVSSEFFANKVNAIDFYNFFNGMKSELSLELLIATYGYNGQCENELSEMIKGFCIKHAYASLSDVKMYIVTKLMNENTKKVLNLADRPVVEMIDILKNAESTALLFDDRVMPRDANIANFDANWRKITADEIVKLSRITFRVFRDLIGWPGPATEDSKVVHYGFFAGFEEINNPPAWKNKLNLILDNVMMIAMGAERNKVNGMLLDYIDTARKTNREMLRPYVINGCI